MLGTSRIVGRGAVTLIALAAGTCWLPAAGGAAALVPRPATLRDTSEHFASPRVSPSIAAGPFAYILNLDEGGEVVPLNTSTHAVGLPIQIGDPRSMAIAPDGQTGFVASNDGGGVAPLSLPRGPAEPFIYSFPSVAVGYLTDNVAVSPDGSMAYVASLSAKSVVPISLASHSALKPINVGGFAIAVAITPDGKTVYAANNDDDTLIPIATDTNKAGAPIPLGDQPQAIAVTPDGRTAYVANAGGTVTPITTATNAAGPPIKVGKVPFDIAITPNGKTAYVVNGGDNTVTPIAIATNKPGRPISITGIDPEGIAITPDGKTVYVTTDHSVTPIATATNKAGPAIVSPRFGVLTQLAIAPDEAPVAELSVTPEPAGSATPTRFDASRSTAPSSRIVAYRWNFGDGHTATTTGPITTHRYASADTYAASVTETDAAGTSTKQVFTGQTMSRNGGPSAVASADVVIVSCTSTGTCAGSVNVAQTVSTPSHTIAFTGTPTAAVGTVHLAVAPASVVCPAEDPSIAPVADLTDVGFDPSADLTITTTLRNTIRAATHAVCYESAVPFLNQASPTIPTAGTALLLDCTDTANVAPCVLSTQQVGADVVVQFVVPGGDPRFHIVAPTPIRSAVPTLPRGAHGQSYFGRFSTVGGIGAASWTLTRGKLPPGLSLNPNGTITGKPSHTGRYIFTLQANDTEAPPETASIVASISVV